MTEITYREALRRALDEAMREDARLIVMGEEVGRYGGAYGVTKGLLDRYGPERVRDTPISEAGIVGAALGAALTGLRPVAELMYVGFLRSCDGSDRQSDRQDALHVRRSGRCPCCDPDTRRHRPLRRCPAQPEP